MALEMPRDFSYADYAALPDDRRYQVIEGELVLTPSPTFKHQDLVGAIFAALRAHVAATGAGTACVAPLDVVLRAEAPAVVVQPDVLFVARAHRDRITAANIQGAPDLVIEVLSPSNARLDATRKKALYARYGVAELWLVFPDLGRVEIYQQAEGADVFGPPRILDGDATVTTPLLPGLAIALGPLFAEEAQPNL